MQHALLYHSYHIFKGKRLNDNLMTNAAIEAAYANSDSGWVNGTVLMEYLTNHFLKYVQRGAGDNNESIMLIFDGHASLVSMEIVK